jgi:hypothetical protein
MRPTTQNQTLLLIMIARSTDKIDDQDLTTRTRDKYAGPA